MGFQDGKVRSSAGETIGSKSFQLAAVVGLSKTLKSNLGGSREPRRASVVTSSNRRCLFSLNSTRGRDRTDNIL